MIEPPIEGAIVPDPTEEEFFNLNTTEEQLDSTLLGTDGFDIPEDELRKIKVRFKK